MGIGKALIGILLLIAPLVVYWFEYVGYWNYGLLNSFLTILEGTIPALIALVGLLLIWVSMNELKA